MIDCPSGELVATKGRLADLSALETLYGSARDELDRLDKENLELKDMVATGTVTLGRSRWGGACVLARVCMCFRWWWGGEDLELKDMVATCDA